MATTDLYGLVGQVLDGQFRVDRPIGEGGFSVVYRGQHIGLDEPVAIKCLKLQNQLGSAVVEGFIRRFRDESKIHYRLSRGSLHIARTIAAGTTMAPATGALVPYMVLEWLEGFTLSEELRARRMRNERGRSLQEVVRLLDPVAEAMAFAHSQGVVHRDLNPSNIFVAHAHGTSKLKVLDFGVAKVISDHALALGPRVATMGQIRMFTPAYAAPEQFHEALGPISAQTDVYSFAVMVVELLADRTPIEGEHIGEYADRALDPEHRPTPRAMGISVGDAAEAVIARAVTVDPSQRPSDVGEFWGMLKNAANRDAHSTRGSGAPGFPKSPGMAAPSVRGGPIPGVLRNTAGRLPAPEAPPVNNAEDEASGGEGEPSAGRYFYSSRPKIPIEESPPPKTVVDSAHPAARVSSKPPPRFGGDPTVPLGSTLPSADRPPSTEATNDVSRKTSGPLRRATLLQGSPVPTIPTPQPQPSPVRAATSTLPNPPFSSSVPPGAPGATFNSSVPPGAPAATFNSSVPPGATFNSSVPPGATFNSSAPPLGSTMASPIVTPAPFVSEPPKVHGTPMSQTAATAATLSDTSVSSTGPRSRSSGPHQVWHSPTPGDRLSPPRRVPSSPASTRSSSSPANAKNNVPLLVVLALALTVTLVVVAIVANQLAH